MPEDKRETRETEETKVALVDDHRLFRKGMAGLVSGFGGYRVVLEAGHGRELIEGLAQTLPDIVLLDITMPVMYGSCGWPAPTSPIRR